MLARSSLLCLIATVSLASLARQVANVAHAATLRHAQVVASASPGPMFSPLMAFRPIGKHTADSTPTGNHFADSFATGTYSFAQMASLASTAYRSSPPVLYVYQAGKAFEVRSNYVTRDGALNSIDFQGRPSHGLSPEEKIHVDGSIDVLLLPFDLSIPIPQDNAAYLVETGAGKKCWFISGFPATRHPHRPIVLYDDRSRPVVTIYTELPINAGSCDRPRLS